MIRRIIASVIINALALYATVWLLSDITYTGGLKFFVLGGILIGVLNALVKPVLKLLSLPLVVLSAGLFILVINALLFWLFVKLVGVLNVTGVSVAVNDGLTYVFASIIFAAVNYVLYLVFKKI